MKLVTSKNKKFGSKFIRFITGEEESHFLFVFDKSLVFHSNFQGTGLAWWNHYLRQHEIVWSLDVNLPPHIEEAFYMSFVDKYYGQPYDFMGALYLGVRMIMFRCLSVPLPDKNLWGLPNNTFCSELSFKPDWDLIKPGLNEKLKNFVGDMVTPRRARSILDLELRNYER